MRRPGHPLTHLWIAGVSLALLSSGASADEPWRVHDLAALDPEAGGLLRVLGSVGTGASGLPVAGGHDVDGDGFQDVAVASMRASPLGRTAAGQVFLVFGDGSVRGSLDTAVAQPRVLEILGDGRREATGSEIWMDDVTGDGLGDLLVARQNLSFGSRTGAGALTIVVGGPALRELAERGQPLDLRDPAGSTTLTHLVGSAALARLGIWMRTGDVTGDGIADLVVGADQESTPQRRHFGAAYVVRGGEPLARAGTVDLASFGATALAGHVARLTPEPDVAEYHFGGTCQIADLDGNGRGEVLVAATINRAGAGLRADGAPPGSAHASAGAPSGRLYVAWDDNFGGGPWPPGLTFHVSEAPGGRTILSGGPGNVSFGEEILGGLDYDGDGAPDLFVGDIVGDADGTRPGAGSGHLFFDAARLRNRVRGVADPPPGVRVTTILGGSAGDISSDTAGHGDFDGDGVADLALASPHADPFGRRDAGAVHVLFGRLGPWPALVDLATGALPAPAGLRVAEVRGARGGAGPDAGDTLSYSAAVGDLDGDGRSDLVTNEMLGNGATPAAEDAGNLIVLGGELLAGGVSIEIAPFSRALRASPFSKKPFAVAILGTGSLDVRDIDVGTLAFGPRGARPLFDLTRWIVFLLSHRDVNRDGHRDLLLWLDPRAAGLPLGDARACLVGTRRGLPFHACDGVRVLGPACGLGWELGLVLPLLAWLRRRRRDRGGTS